MGKEANSRLSINAKKSCDHTLYLHPGFHHIQRGVAKDTRSSGSGPKHASDKGVYDLIWIIPCGEEGTKC